MQRLGLVSILLCVATRSGSANEVSIPAPTSQVIGTYQGPGYRTHFDGQGRWATSPNHANAPNGGGRYAIDGDLIFFSATPPACPQERVRYRLASTPEGFRLRFLDDSCARHSQMPDIVFVRVKR